MPDHGKKRTAHEAFQNEGSKVPGSVKQVLNNHRAGKKSSKTIQFEDSAQNDQKTDSTKGQHDYRKSTSKAKLKQRSQDLLSVRQKLPIFNHANEIRSKLRQNDVLLLVGHTGSGKSTQIPQFLMNEKWCQTSPTKQGEKIGGCIAITQPRRVAAISLARRVAEEVGTPLGNLSPASLVGYSVRFDNNTSPSTRIKFVTEGSLLQELLRDPWLKEYSAVVVDEVHERGVNVDLVLGFLKTILDQRSPEDGRKGVPLKIVVMSATTDMDMIQGFFNAKIPVDSNTSEQRNVPVESSKDKKDVINGKRSESKHSISVTSLHIPGRQYPVTLHYVPAPIPDVLDAALQRIIHIHTHSPLPGDILVFLTGQETIESLASLVENYSISIQKDPTLSKQLPKILVRPLFAALPTHLQQAVFQQTPDFTRKIILATNIAETSITVPGIRHVIDSGKHKQKLFRPSLNLDSLLTSPISRSSATQRSGRAGRDAPGNAYRLYTESTYLSLAADTEPEILRCDLSQLVLTLKAHNIANPILFPFLTPPPRRSLERALVHLLQLSALSPTTGAITSIGHEMSRLPLSAPLARVLLSSTQPSYNCAREIIDIVSALSVENIFLNLPSSSPEDSQSSTITQAISLRQTLSRREGDHLTLLSVVQTYAEESIDRKRWCLERFISHRAMLAIMDVRKQLTQLISKSHPESLTEKNPSDPATLSTRILKTLLTGLHPNVARIGSAGSDGSGGMAYRTLGTNQVVAIHPSSVLFHANISRGGSVEGRKAPVAEAIMYSELVFTNKTYARGVSAVQMQWVGEVVREMQREQETE